MAVQIQVRRGTAAEWVAENPLLSQGEIGVELDTLQLKIGNGVLQWNSLPYASGNVTTTGTQTIINKTLVNPTITNYTETFYAPAAGTAFTLDFANGTIQRFTTSGNLTITLPASVAGKSCVVEVVYGGAHTVTFAGGTAIKYAGGTAPSATSVSGKIDRWCVEQDGTATLISDAGRNF